MRSCFRSVLLISISFGLAGCLGDDPAVMGTLMLRPDAAFSVFDASGAAIVDAEVFLLTKAENQSLWSGQVLTNKVQTDNFGGARFSGRTEMYGGTGYKLANPPNFFWAICIQKAGYATHRQIIGRTSDGSAEIPRVVLQIKLKLGASTPCPSRNSSDAF